jgi:hypothetical protein
MRVLCEAPQPPASLSPAVGVADGFPTPCGGGGMAMAKRPIDRDCHTRGHGNQSLPYIYFPQLSLAWHSANGEKGGENLLYLPVENFGSNRPKYRKNERWDTVRISDKYRKNKR